MAEVAEMAEKRENYATYAIYASANFYTSGNNRERIFYLSKITKNDSKILISFTKDAKETKLHVYKKMHVRLWDFGTLKSHSLKVSV